MGAARANGLSPRSSGDAFDGQVVVTLSRRSVISCKGLGLGYQYTGVTMTTAWAATQRGKMSAIHSLFKDEQAQVQQVGLHAGVVESLPHPLAQAKRL